MLATLLSPSTDLRSLFRTQRLYILLMVRGYSVKNWYITVHRSLLC